MCLQLQQRIPKQALVKPGEIDLLMNGMYYNSAHDELFFADWWNKVLRSIRLGDEPSELRDVYRVTHGGVYSVCHMSESDTLLVCSSEQNKRWMLALNRNESEWREAQRVQIEASGETAIITCALSDSRVLIGEIDSQYMEMLRLKSGPIIEREHFIQITERYRRFSAMCGGSDTFVAMSFLRDQSVRVYIQRGDRLEELARTHLQWPNHTLYLSDSLIIEEYNRTTKKSTITELEICGTQLESRRQHIAANEEFNVRKWCTMDKRLAIFDSHSGDILIYKLT